MKFMTFVLSMAFMGTAIGAPLHLDLEMTSAEYAELLKKQAKANTNKSMTSDDPAISNAIKIGERLSKWIAKVNTGRTTETAIRLTSAATRRGIPIDKPNMYSPSIIKKDTETALSELPKEMRDVLLSNDELPGSIPMDDETFITLARKVDRNYQSAARYKSIDQYRYYYVQAASRDVRGYYYLTKNKIGENELQDTRMINPSQVSSIKEALRFICLNSVGDMSKCKKEVETAYSKNKLAGLYNKYIARAKKTWDNFFVIPVDARRQDIEWSTNTARVPFNTPEIPKFIPYLKNNIEDEFRWGNWGLKIIFGSFANGPLLKFEPGVVPHVNGLGGNEIVMDSNQPIEEYESQWTIRHEFGHVLGLPDCYHEFYDTTANAYVNYQLDITDLMCSRAGNMNERIFKELKDAYDRNL